MPDPIEIPPVNPPEPPNLPDDGDEKEKIDPGSLEGLPKAEPTDSHNVQKRIDKLTKKFRDEERARLDLEKKLADIDAAHQRDMEIARQHNDQLIAAMKTAQAPKEKPPENVNMEQPPAAGVNQFSRPRPYQVVYAEGGLPV